MWTRCRSARSRRASRRWAREQEWPQDLNEACKHAEVMVQHAKHNRALEKTTYHTEDQKRADKTKRSTSRVSPDTCETCPGCKGASRRKCHRGCRCTRGEGAGNHDQPPSVAKPRILTERTHTDHNSRRCHGSRQATFFGLGASGECEPGDDHPVASDGDDRRLTTSRAERCDRTRDQQRMIVQGRRARYRTDEAAARCGNVPEEL